LRLRALRPQLKRDSLGGSIHMTWKAILYLCAVGLALALILWRVAKAHRRSSDEGAESRRSGWDIG